MKPTRRLHSIGAVEAGVSAPLTTLFDPDSQFEVMQKCIERYQNRIAAVRVLVGHHEREGDQGSRLTILSAHRYDIPVITRVESSMVVIPKGMLPFYLDLCAERGITRIQFRKGSLPPIVRPRDVIALASDRNLEIQFEIDSTCSPQVATNQETHPAIQQAFSWLDAGAVGLVADARLNSNTPDIESRNDTIDTAYADALARTFGLHTIMFKAPGETIQRALLTFLGPETPLCDVPLRDISTIESNRTSAWVLKIPADDWKSQALAQTFAG